MKRIFKIAKNEFHYLFYSPIAWFIMIVFVAQCGYFYTAPLSGVANTQDILLQNSPKFKGVPSLTAIIFLIKGEIFPNIIGNLYLFLPLLTMGLINREINNRTIDLLYSSPISLRTIVLGKYLGIMLYNLLLVLLAGIMMASGFFSIQHADYGIFLSAALGLYLLIGAYSAIGLFVSSLTSFQIVSALSSFAIFFILARIGGLWQRYDLVRDLTYFLSMQNRTAKMLGGLISTKDVIYYLIVSGMFVCFTLLKLKDKREDRPWYVKSGRYIIVAGVALVIGYFSSQPKLTGYWDTTATQRNTIHPRTQKLLKDMGDSTLEVTLYCNLLGDGMQQGLPELRNIGYLSELWESYLRFKPDIRFKYVYYYDYDSTIDNGKLLTFFPDRSVPEIAAQIAETIDADTSMFKTPAEMQHVINLRSENLRLVMQLKYRGRTTFLRTFEDPLFWPDETNVIAALQHLVTPRMPNITYISGELERNIFKTGEREYSVHSGSKAHRGSLVNIGFDVDTVNLSTQEISPEVTTLVLADPKMALSSAVTDRLKRYADNGGNMFIIGEPGKQHILNPLLKQLGVQLADGQLVQPTFDETPDKVKPMLTIEASGLSEGLSPLKKKEAQDTFDLLMPGTTTINCDSNHFFKTTPLALGIPGATWLKTGQLVVDSTLPPFNPREGDRNEGPFPTVLQLSRLKNNKEQRIIISGDADFASNIRIGNSFFLIPLYSWLAYNQSPIYLPRTPSRDTLLSIGSPAATTQKIVYVWILPGILLLTGTILLIRRKRK